MGQYERADMDKALARQIGQETLAALQAVAEAHGLTVETRGGSYDSGSFSPKITFKADDADEKTFALYARMFGLEPAHYLAQFACNGRRFEITGLNPRAPKFPVKARCLADGKSYKFSSENVEVFLSREAK